MKYLETPLSLKHYLYIMNTINLQTRLTDTLKRLSSQRAVRQTSSVCVTTDDLEPGLALVGHVTSLLDGGHVCVCGLLGVVRGLFNTAA